MAHNLMYSRQLGRMAAMYADNAAWHGLGIVVKGAKNWKETMELAGLNWTVGKYPLFDQAGKQVSAWGVFKNDANGNPVEFIAPVGDRYTPIQNEYAFSFVDSLLEAQDGMHYDSAGALGNGERVWCLARVPFDFKVNGGDEHQTYLLFTTSHDGSLAAQCRLTTVRVVCQNTLNMAVSMNGSYIKVKHTKDAEVRLDAARKLMGNAKQTVETLKEKLDTLSRRMLNKESFMSVIDRLFPKPKDPNASETKRNNLLSEIARLFEHNDGNTFPEERGTALNLLNSITEYTDHFRTTRRHDKSQSEDQSRTESAIFGGSGDSLKQNALEVIMEATANCPVQSQVIYSQPIIQTNTGLGLLDDIIQATNGN